jgi:hypothetical protein
MENLVINKNIEAKSSFEWIKSAFFCFREQPIHFILLSIVGIGVTILPLFSAFLSPLFTARFAAIAGKIENNERIQISELFNNFFANATLVRLAFLNFVLIAILVMSMSLVGKELSVMFLLPLSFLLLALWLSPIICLNNPEVLPLPAMWLSIKFALYNMPVLFLFSIQLLAFTLVMCIPIAICLLIWGPSIILHPSMNPAAILTYIPSVLCFLIWVPVLNITSYYVYKNAFTR